MNRRLFHILAFGLVILGIAPGLVGSDRFQGDWEGSFVDAPVIGRFLPATCFAHVIATGEAQYRIVMRADAHERADPHFVVDVTPDGDRLTFANGTARGVIQADTFSGAVSHGERWIPFELRRIVRQSPTIGVAPPAGADVLFDGDSTTAWLPLDPRLKTFPWTVTEAGTLRSEPRVNPDDPFTSIRTRKAYGDVLLHLEFRLPLEPENRGQRRANSGVFLQDRYEVQILDSYGTDGLWNEAGAIYKVVAPRVNASFPPGHWQTYDILFQTPRFDADGKRLSPAVMTVWHNGVRIHYQQEVVRPTIGSPDAESDAPAPIWLQDHNHQIEFRNLWVLDLTDAKALPPVLRELQPASMDHAF